MKRAFISFDYDNDVAKKNLLAGQAKMDDSPFEMADWSMKEAAPEANWESKARSRIERSDVVIVLLGRNTHKAPGVLKEVAMARATNTPIVQITDLDRAVPVKDAGKHYKWTWPNLKALLK